MFAWKSILIGLGLALLLNVIILFARGTTEVFIYNMF